MIKHLFQRNIAQEGALPDAARIVVRLLQNIHTGGLALEMPGEIKKFFGDATHALQVTWHVKDWRVFTDLLRHTDIGLGKSYVADRWITNDLAAFIKLAILNRNILTRLTNAATLSLIAYRVRHALRKNTKQGSQKNILAHYDLGNEFYKLWLDDSMTYSSALFQDDPQRSLTHAQEAKYSRILKQINCQPHQTVLEIGCGWGAFAEAAAKQDICVHGVTLSPSQLAYAQLRTSNFHERVRPQLRLQDYRDIQGQYDHVVSIEMFEAVGHKFWATYFDAVKRLLKPSGSVLIQTIVIADELFDHYKKNTDFIQQYIFPGGMLPSISVFHQVAQRSGLRVVEAYPFGLDYAETLKVWRARFMCAWDNIQHLGFDMRFKRLWEFYLAYCEAGFAAGSTNVYQIKLTHQNT